MKFFSCYKNLKNLSSVESWDPEDKYDTKSNKWPAFLISDNITLSPDVTFDWIVAAELKLAEL